jgi:hypothetical protein
VQKEALMSFARPLVRILLLAATAALLVPAAASASDDAATATAPPPPKWYTPDLHKRVIEAKGKPVQTPVPKAEINCLGYSPPSGSPSDPLRAVSAGGCMVYPHGCTANFVFTDGTSKYIGSAGHCLSGRGGTVVMQVATRVDPTDTVMVALAAVGKTTKKVDAGIGRDFGVARIDPQWPVVPGVAGAAGPTGVFCGDPLGQPVVHYGHGYVFYVEQGNPKAGEVIPDLTLLVKFASTEYGFNWVGYGLPGDSGSPVMNPAGLAVGDLTHGLGVDVVPIPGWNAGTTTAGMFNILGRGYSMVTVDGRSVKCSGSPIGV